LCQEERTRQEKSLSDCGQVIYNFFAYFKTIFFFCINKANDQLTRIELWMSQELVIAAFRLDLDTLPFFLMVTDVSQPIIIFYCILAVLLICLGLSLLPNNSPSVPY
jgi:hypothetical protein